ncbi:uncharacterized protein LOC143021120 [Oratosquilla oratoria]|uniref:uncharacterized protein LOC143021120 n=1 Tax=Oratosquilla oratoria TaxID=337810 RepID=UPI003F775323
MSEPPTFQDFPRAIKLMRPGKTPGLDNIPVELFTHGGQEVKTHLMNLLLRIWESETVPGDPKNANIVTIKKKEEKKKKKDRMSYCNYRGISLLIIVRQIFARLLLDRLLKLAEEVLPESQCGFRPSRGTVDTICARKLQEMGR